MIRLAFAAIYLAGAVAAILLLNANDGYGELALVVWALASVLLGWGTGRFGFFLLAFLAIPIAVPFGVPDDYQFSEPPWIWWWTLVLSFPSAGLILIGALAKQIGDGRRHRRAAS